jgi:hypothetical protein
MSDKGEEADADYQGFLKEFADSMQLDKSTFTKNTVFCAAGGGSGCLMSGLLAKRYGAPTIIAVTFITNGFEWVSNIFPDAECIDDDSIANGNVWHIPPGSQLTHNMRSVEGDRYYTHHFIEEATKNLNIGVVWIVPEPGTGVDIISDLITAGLTWYGPREFSLTAVNQGMNICSSKPADDVVVFDALKETGHQISVLIVGVGTDGSKTVQELLSDGEQFVRQMRYTHNLYRVEDTDGITDEIISEMAFRCPGKRRTYNYFAEASRLHAVRPLSVMRVRRPWHREEEVPTFPVKLLITVLALTPKLKKSAGKH